MNRPALGIGVIAALLVLPLGLLAGSGVVPAHLVIIALGSIAIAYGISRRLTTEGDPWLPTLMLWAVIAKLVGAFARHFVLFELYEGGGDAVAYHQAGLQAADVWRTLTVPVMESVGSGSIGTHFVGWLTGLIYAPFEPSSLGGFFIFAFMAFIGQVFMYVGFRHSMSVASWRRYAIVIFFWPTLLYWPSSLGKEAVITLFLGLGVWGVARLYRAFRFGWLIPVAGAAALIGIVRIHVAALLVGSALVGGLFARGPGGIAVGFRRVALVAIGMAAMIPLVLSVATEFGVALEGTVTIDDLDPALTTIETQTEQGDSAVDEGAIRSPADIPAAFLKVMFRPLPYEAANLQTLVASVEGLLLMGFILWRLPACIRNSGRILRSPYLMFCAVYSAGFIFAWSAINNLGIMARQRSLLLPFVLAVIVGLGWNDSRDDATHPSDESRDRSPDRLVPVSR